MAVAFKSAVHTRWASSTTVNPAKPPGMAVGDVVFVHMHLYEVQVVIPPAGWRLVAFARQSCTGYGNNAGALWVKVMTAADVAAADMGVWSTPSSQQANVEVSAYTGANVTDPISYVGMRGGYDIAIGTEYPWYWPEAYDVHGNGMDILFGSNGFPGTSAAPGAIAGYTKQYDVINSDGYQRSVLYTKLLGAAGLVAAPSAATNNTQSTAKVTFNVVLRDANSLDIQAPWMRGHSFREQAEANALWVPNAGITVGDILLLFIDEYQTTAFTPSLPAGWNLLAARVAGASLVTRTIYWKKATAAECVQEITITGLPSSTQFFGHIIVLANAGTPTAPQTTIHGANEGGVPTAPAITTLANSLLVFFAFSLNDWTETAPPAGYSSRSIISPTYYNNAANRLSAAISVKSVGAGVQPAASDTPAIGYWAATHVAVSVSNVPPDAPTLVAPADAQATDLSGTPTFDWVFNDQNIGDTQSGFYLRRKVVGAPAYEYWNSATGLWQAGEVKNAQVASDFTFPAGKWANGVTYNWSVATEDQLNTKGAYAPDFTVTGGTAAALVVNGPLGTIIDNIRPPITWTVTDPEGDPQQTSQVIVESGAYGTMPGAGTQLFDTGEVAEPARRSWTPLMDLAGSVAYRAFVRVKTNGQYSAWAYSSFVIQLNRPAAPVLSVAFDQPNNRMILTLQGRDNMLSTNQASLETDTSGWYVGVNSTIARSTAQFVDGVASLAVTSIVAAAMSVVTTNNALTAVPVTPGAQYTALASVRAATVARICDINLRFYDAAGAMLADVNGAPTMDAVGAWTQLAVTGVAPAGAAFAAIYIDFAAATAGEVHYTDKISLAPGASTTWSRGGLSGQTYLFERSDDGGITWVAVRDADNVPAGPGQVTVVYDYTAPPNVPVQYRASARVIV